MKSSTRVCPWQNAWTLDSWIRRLVHNPHKIVGGYIKEGQTVLDLGSGPGMFSIAMAEIVGEKGKVISVDIQEEMLQMLKRKSERAGLESRILIHKSQPDKIGVSDEVDFALAFYMVHEVPNREGFLREVTATLKPQGKLLIAEPIFHVSRSSFQDTVEIAKSTGLRVISWPKIFFSSAVLLQRKSI